MVEDDDHVGENSLNFVREEQNKRPGVQNALQSSVSSMSINFDIDLNLGSIDIEIFGIIDLDRSRLVKIKLISY